MGLNRRPRLYSRRRHENGPRWSKRRVIRPESAFAFDVTTSPTLRLWVESRSILLLLLLLLARDTKKDEDTHSLFTVERVSLSLYSWVSY